MKIKSLERIPLNPGLLSQGAPLHTPPSCVKCPANLASTHRNWTPILAKGSQQYRPAGSAPVVGECCPEGVLALGGTTKKFLGNSEET